MMVYICHYHSPLGGITISSNGKKIIGLKFDNQKQLDRKLLKDHKEKALPIFDETKKWLDTYFSRKAPDFIPPIKLDTTPFRKSVLEIVQTIPFGQTMTYGEIANHIAKQRGLAKMSAQAVGRAVGSNPILLIIPCHRVVGANGNLTGYAGGLKNKLHLLTMDICEINLQQIKRRQKMNLCLNCDGGLCSQLYKFCFHILYRLVCVFLRLQVLLKVWRPKPQLCRVNGTKNPDTCATSGLFLV